MFNKLPIALVVFGISISLASPGAAQPAQSSVLTWPSESDPASLSPPGMTYVPGGQAIIGLDEKEIQDMKLESIVELQSLSGSVPRRQLPMKGFYLDTAEVTNHEWQVYLQATGQEPSEDLVKFSWKEGTLPAGTENHPVVCVSFKQASAYAAWAGKRLPTEEEWEYAARGAGGFSYPWGNEFDGTKAHCSSSKMVGGRRAQESGTLAIGKSPFGLFDMAGNVWEWTSSSYLPYEGYKDIMVKTKYTKGKPAPYSATELFSAQKQVIRGGSWQNPKTALLSALRQGAEGNTWNTTVGFRCAKSAQAGVEVLADAMLAVGRHYFKGHELDLGSTQATEVTHYDGTQAVTSHQGIVFAPIKSWKSLTLVQKQSKKDPVVAGLIYTSEEIVVPRLQPGAYWLAYQTGDKQVKLDKGATFPAEGWVYQGWETHDTAAKPKAAKESFKKPAKRNSKQAPDEEKPAEEEAAEAEPDNEVRYEASEGSITYDRHQDNLLLINSANHVLAAFPLDELKDGARSTPSALTIQKMGEDKLHKLPATERRTYAFTINVPGKKAVAFELPLRFHPEPLKAGVDSTSKVVDDVGIENR